MADAISSPDKALRSDQSLFGRLAVVTGGSRGIGKAIALELAERGADIAIVYAGRADAAADVCRQVVDLGVRASAHCCDVADFAASRATCQAVLDEHGHADILVNNAGIVKDDLVMKMSEQDFDQVVAVNLKGVFNMSRHLLPALLRSPHGRIISITSVVGLTGNPGQANYTAAKAGVIGFSKTLAREVAGRGVTCNTIAPGLITTDMTAQLPPATLEKLGQMIPLRRPGTPEDVAHTAAFLASDQAGYITGQVLAVDGGLSMTY